ncbi:MAG: hypothetical protein U0231_03590 [Nitrospiraceae bacterium]
MLISERVRPGELFTSFHFPDSDLNVLVAHPARTTTRKCPEYKVSTVRIEKVGPASGLSVPVHAMLIG